jgi:hypothetical protein
MEMVNEKIFLPLHFLLTMVVALRLVDNKAILYFDAPTPSDALNWYRGPSMFLSFFLV